MAISVELVTSITIVLIGVIIAVYLVVLKRNGWICKNTNYRCPNQQCKKIFQKPIEVKDLADKHKVHFACPECGYDLGAFDSGKSLEEITVNKEPELKIKEEPTKTQTIENSNASVKDGVPEIKPVKIEVKEAQPEIETKPKLFFKKS